MGVGRPPKPTEIKILEGNRGKRPLNKNEPKPDLYSLFDMELAKARKNVEEISEKIKTALTAKKVNLIRLAQLQKKQLEAITSQKEIEKRAGISKLIDKLPNPPDFLDENAKRVWWDNIEVLVSNKLFTEADTYALAGFCLAWSQIISAQKVTSEKLKGNLVFKTSKDENSNYIMSTPYTTIIQKNLVIAKAYASEFGMTPSSRGRMQLPVEGGKKVDDEMESLLNEA